MRNRTAGFLLAAFTAPLCCGCAIGEKFDVMIQEMRCMRHQMGSGMGGMQTELQQLRGDFQLLQAKMDNMDRNMQRMVEVFEEEQ